MRGLISRVTLLCLCAAGGLLSAAAAETPQRPSYTAYRVDHDVIVMMPAEDVRAGEERVVGEGDKLLRALVAYPRVAQLSAPLDADVAGQHYSLPAGTQLLEMRARGGALARDQEGVFCLQERAPTRVRPDYRQGEGNRYYPFVRPCFLDRDSDGRLDAGLLVGTNWTEERALFPLTPVAFVDQRDVILPNSDVTITLVEPALLGRNALDVQLRLLGDFIPLASLRASVDGRRYTRIDHHFGVGGDVYPKPADYVAGRIEVLSLDRQAHQARVRFATPFERVLLRYEISVPVTYIPVYVGR
jgi:hypothetical protein